VESRNNAAPRRGELQDPTHCSDKLVLRDRFPSPMRSCQDASLLSLLQKMVACILALPWCLELGVWSFLEVSQSVTDMSDGLTRGLAEIAFRGHVASSDSTASQRSTDPMLWETNTANLPPQLRICLAAVTNACVWAGVPMLIRK
jgi:hypothetical protein